MKLISNTIFSADYEMRPPRDGFGQGLIEVGSILPNVVALTGDLAESTRVLEFSKKFPDRFIEVGVAEQNMAGIAAGLSFGGKIPFMTSYAVFSPGRNWDQIRVSICYSKANVKIVGAHAGISVGPDGATHQALEDLAITRVLPNLTIIVPTDAEETRKAVHAMAHLVGPAYIRFGREKTPVITTAATPFILGKANLITDGSDVTIIANGQMVFRALQAVKQLENQISLRVLNLHTLKPLDTEAIISAAKETGAIVTAEEHQVINGLGAAVAETLAEAYPVPIERVGVKDTFGESGEPDELMKLYGLDDQAIIKAIHKVLKLKKR